MNMKEYAFGIDLGGTTAKVGLFTTAGALLEKWEVPTDTSNAGEHILENLAAAIMGKMQEKAIPAEQVEGVGASAALLLHLMADISQRARITSLPEKILNSPDRTGAYFMELLAGQKRELLYQVCLDGKGKLLTCRCIAKGTVSASAVHVRQVVENALYAGASTIILAHNHPSGIAVPSSEDVQTTCRVAMALNAVEIQLADHIVVADGDYVSMVQSGYRLDEGSYYGQIQAGIGL